MDPFDLKGHCAVVVGAGGLGRPIAIALADRGAGVGVADFDLGRAESTAAEIREAGRIAPALQVDITSKDSVKALEAGVLTAFPRVDIVVNAVGITVRKRAEDVNVEEWRRGIDVNLTGSFITCQVFGAEMARSGGGSIINISSVRGRYGSRLGQTEYSASKGGHRLHDALARRPMGGVWHSR